MVIKASSSAEIRALVTALGGADDVHREAAIARLAVIGSRSVDRLIEAYGGTPDRRTRLAILRALEAIADRRAAPLARLAVQESGDLGVAALGVLRALLTSRQGSTASESLDTLVAVALDAQHERRVRLAALEALQDVPDDVRTRVAHAMEATSDRTLDRIARMADRDAARIEAMWTDAVEGRLPDNPHGPSRRAVGPRRERAAEHAAEARRRRGRARDPGTGRGAGRVDRAARIDSPGARAAREPRGAVRSAREHGTGPGAAPGIVPRRASRPWRRLVPGAHRGRLANGSRRRTMASSAGRGVPGDCQAREDHQAARRREAPPREMA